MRNPARRRLADVLAVALSCGLLAVPSLALAQAQPVDATLAATRRETIAQALEAQRAGHHQRAYELSTRAGQIQMSTGLRAMIAQEAEAVGQLGVALGAAQLCVREADRDQTLPDRTEVLRVCHDVATRLASRVGRVMVQVADPPAGLQVRVAGAELPAVAWGLPYVVTPGRVLVEAHAPGRTDFRREVEVAAGGTGEVSVTLAALAEVTTPPPAPTGPVDTAPAGRRGPGVAPWLVVGVGAVGLVLGGVFYPLMRDAEASRNAQCFGTAGCHPEAVAFNDQAHGYQAAMFVAFGVGAAAVVGGLTWYLVARPRAARPVHAGLAPVPGGMVFSVGGSL